MAIKFKERTKQDRLDLMPGTPVAFEDDRAEEYFVAAGFAEATNEDPVVTYPVGSVMIDDLTVFAGTGSRVMEG